jgi:L-threonine kinase
VTLYQGAPEVIGPEHSPKAIRAVQATLAYLGRADLGAELAITSSLPRGKGMASSTADVVGAISATASALGVNLSPQEIAGLALSIEPSDGVMFPGIVLFDHREGSLYEELGMPPPMEVIVLDFGGTVDTLDFNRVDRREALSRMELEFKEALELVRRGIASSDPALVGKGATLSAWLNQRILYKPQLKAVMDFADSVGAVGVNVAHSGTAIGILLDRRQGRGDETHNQARRVFPDLEESIHLQLIGGGISVG